MGGASFENSSGGGDQERAQRLKPQAMQLSHPPSGTRGLPQSGHDWTRGAAATTLRRGAATRENSTP